MPVAKTLAARIDELGVNVGAFLADEVVPKLLPDGGATAQVPTKQANGSVVWATPPAGTGGGEDPTAEIDAAIASIASRLLPTGGATTQVPTKQANGSVLWATPAAGGQAVADTRVLAQWFADLGTGLPVLLARVGDSTQPNNQPTGWATSFYEMRNVTESVMSQNGQTLEFWLDEVNNNTSQSFNAWKAINNRPSLVHMIFGLNDARGADTVTDAQKLAFAVKMRGLVLSFVNKVRGKWPGVPIMIDQPNFLAANSSHASAPNTPQTINEALLLAFEGDPTKGVQRMDTVAPNVLMLSVNGTVFRNYAADTNLPFLENDGTHPQPGGNAGYTTRQLAEAQVIVPIFNPTKSALIEQGAARGQRCNDLTTLLGPDYYLTNAGQVTVCDANGHNVSLNGGPSIVYHATGIVSFGQNAGDAACLGLVPGDIPVWDRIAGETYDRVDLITKAPTGAQGDGDAVRWEVSRGAGDWCNRVFGSANPPFAVGRTFRIFRHRYAFSAAVRNEFRMRSGSPGERTMGTTPFAYRFWIKEAAMNYLVIQGIAGELDGRTFQNASEHLPVVTDRLHIAGVTGNAGLTLTGATIVREGTGNRDIRITMTGTDFRGAGVPQGFIFTKSTA